MKKIIGNFYSGKKVLITGHTGFKGTWLTEWLAHLGAEIAGLALSPNTAPALYTMLDLDKKIRSFVGDIRDYSRVESLFQSFKPDIVFHLAAQPLVKYSYKQPKETLEANIIGTINVLEAARTVHAPRVLLNITSDKCYANQEQIPGYKETDPMGGDDPYSASKGCSELITAAYRKSFFSSSAQRHTSVATARAGNVIGGGDWADFRLIPDCVRSLSEGKEIIIRNPAFIRPWQHVLEPLSGYLWLASSLWDTANTDLQTGWNFGPSYSEMHNVEEITKEAIRLWGRGSYKVIGNAEKETTCLNLDITKAAKELEWKAVLNFEETLEFTIRWYKEYYANQHPMQPAEVQQLTLSQLNDYIDRAQARGLRWSRE